MVPSPSSEELHCLPRPPPRAAAPALALSLPASSEELLSLKNVLLMSQQHLTKAVAALLNQRRALPPGRTGWVFPAGTFGVKVFWFTPKVWAGFGVPLCCMRTQRWWLAERGKNPGKTKKPLQHPAGSIPCLFLLARLQLGMDPTRIWDFGLQTLLRSRAAGLGALPCVSGAIGHQMPSPNPTALVGVTTAAINTPRAPRQLLQPKPMLLTAKRPPQATRLGQFCITAKASKTQTWQPRSKVGFLPGKNQGWVYNHL